MSKIQQKLLITITILMFHFGSVYAQWGQPDTISLQMTDCDGLSGWCLDIPQGDLSNYTIELDGLDYAGEIGGCEVDTFFAYTYAPLFGQGQLGPYFLNGWTVNDQTFTGEFQNTAALVDSMNNWDPQGNWIEFTNNSFILGGQAGSTYSGMDITAIMFGITTTLQANPQDSTPEGTLLQFPRGLYNLVVTEILSGTSMESVVLVACPQAITNSAQLLINTSDTLCFDSIDLGLVGSIASVSSTCNTNNGFTAIEITGNCIQTLGVNLGIDTLCFEICDEYGFCASYENIFEIWTDDEIFTQANIYEITFGADSLHCFDTNVLGGEIIEILETCSNANGTEVIFEELDTATYCINFNAIAIGLDTICFNFIADNGNVLVSTLIVDVLPPSADTVYANIIIGDTVQFCPDITEINTGIDTIYTSCESIVMNTVIFEINDVSLCLEAIGLNIGQDTVCVLVCDENSVCDTTFYYITVTNGDGIPSLIANDDSESTYLNKSVVINYCGNDIIPTSTLVDYYLLPSTEGGLDPLYGSVVFNDDCTLTYQPNTGVCNVVDTFTYVICSQDTCVQAQISVSINCEIEEMEVKTGFTPNYDGTNETFMILGLENYPENRLRVYNRWGSKILDQENYQNDWWGDWNGQPVPDGTYFYLLTTKGGYETSGYLQLQR